MTNDIDDGSILRRDFAPLVVPKQSGKPRGRVLTDDEEAARQRAMRERERDYVRKIDPHYVEREGVSTSDAAADTSPSRAEGKEPISSERREGLAAYRRAMRHLGLD